MCKITEWSSCRKKGLRLSPNDRLLLPKLRKAGIDIDELVDGIRVRTKSFVGHVTLDTFDLLIHPKLKRAPLYELFRYGFELKQIHVLGKQAAADKHFEEILIAELVEEVRSIQRRGPVQQYRKERKDLTEIRGQIDQAVWLRRGGIPSETMPCTFYCRSHDNILNRTLCAGLKLGAILSSSPKVKTACRMLADTFAMFVSEQPLTRRSIADAFRHLNRLNAHYEQALKLVRLLYEGIGGFTHGNDRVERIPGFLFDMNLLFEKCLERLFRENLPGVIFTPQQKYPLFSKGKGKFAFKPDYTIIHGSVTTILDAKYRDLWKKKLPPSMLYQLTVYALAAANPHQSVILYPTLNPEANPQKIDLARNNDKLLCSVMLQPVDLNKLATLVSLKTEAVSRQHFAEDIAFFHQH